MTDDYDKRDANGGARPDKPVRDTSYDDEDDDDVSSDEDVHQRALSRFDRIYGTMWQERLQCIEDRRFATIAGAQWAGEWAAQFENTPKLEINKVAKAVQKIYTEYRQSRLDITFIPKTGGEDSTSDACNDLYRADVSDSNGEEAFDTAFEDAVSGGFGAFRLRACYEDDEDPEDERQRIRIEPIFDADSSVYFDLDAKRQDKSDATCCYVISSMTREAYEDQYEDSPASWPKSDFMNQFDWCTVDAVYVAEYYEVEHAATKLHTYRLVDGSEEKYFSDDFERDEELKAMLKATGAKKIKTRTINRRRVHKWIMSGGGILEDCGLIAGRNIPIIPVYGKRWFIDNIERCMGHVRLTKDSQRLANMQRSKLAEISALGGYSKPILTPEQVAGHALMWAEDHIRRSPYLLINPVTDANGNMATQPPVAYTQTPDIPTPMAALLQLTDQDLEQLLGNQQAGEETTPNVSGKAIELVQNRVDLQSFLYMSNLAKAMRRCGEVWLGMAKELYVEPSRKMKGISQHGDAVQVELMRPNMTKGGEMEYENDLSSADYDVDVTVGPSSSSKREATVRALTGMMQITQDPETLQVLSSMAIYNMEGEGIEDVRDFFRQKLLKMGALKPTEEEAQEMAAAAQAQGPDPNTMFLQASAEQAKAEAVKAQVDSGLKLAQIDKSRADTDKVKADTIKVMADVGNEARKLALESASVIGSMGMQERQQEHTESEAELQRQQQQVQMQAEQRETE